MEISKLIISLKFFKIINIARRILKSLLIYSAWHTFMGCQKKGEYSMK